MNLQTCRKGGRLALVWLGAASFLIGACEDDGWVDGKFAATIVYGTVTTTSGDAVPDAFVVLAWRQGATCEEPPTLWWADSTDAMGRYRAHFGMFGTGPYIGCARLIAEPPSSSSLLPDTVDRSGIRLQSPLDSVEVHLVLRPGAQ
jgi:hypothetical protein